MLYAKKGNDYIVRLEKGEEVLESMKVFMDHTGIQSASVNGIGAAGKAVLGVYDPDRRKYDQQTLEGKMEIVSLNGNLTRMNGEAYVHLHGAVCDATLRVTGGHVLELRISLTAEIFIRALEVKTDRKKSEEFGINLIENLEKIQ